MIKIAPMIEADIRDNVQENGRQTYKSIFEEIRDQIVEKNAFDSKIRCKERRQSPRPGYTYISMESVKA